MTGPTNRILDEDSFYQKIFEHARDSVLVLEPDPNDVLTIRDANEAAIRAHGYSRRELIDRPIRFLDPFTDRAFLVEGVRNLAVSVERDITARKEMELKLKHSRDLMSYVIGHARSAIAVHDRDLRYIYVSERYLQEYNIKEKDVIGRHHYEVFPDLPEKWREVHQRALRGEISSAEEDPYFRDDGSVEWTRWECRPWYEKDGSIGGIIVYTEVIADRVQARQERQALQDQLQQAMKMEAIGRLAGGVAHDFNNQLTCIKGNAEMSLLDLDPASPLARPLREINQAADSAAALTRQLLAFSRKEVIEPRPQDLNTVVKNLRKMLSRLIGEDVSLTVRNDPHLGVVEVDPAQFEQVLVNLAVNARDAMPEGGEITIETANQALGEDEARAYEDISPGHYVRLTVRDTGQGIPGEILAHIFEPFFTTKSKEKGLGLATVFGALKQAGGGIAVESAVGQGTSFTIVLPRIDDPAVEPPKPTGEPLELPGGEDTVVVVDEDLVRRMVVRILRRLGNRVLEAASRQEGLRVAREWTDPIHLLLTDVVMPGMNGRELSARLAEIHPEAAILFSSGYTDDIIAAHGVLEEGITLVRKPYRPLTLATKIREVLASD